MSYWRKSVLAGLGVAAVAFLVYQFVFLKKAKGTSDIHYITEIVPGSEQTGVSTDKVVTTMPLAVHRRIKDLGYIASIKNNGDRIFDITIRDVEDTAMIRQAVTTNNKLEMYEVYTLSELASVISIIEEEANKVLSPAPQQPTDTKLNDTLQKLSLDQPKRLGSLILFSINPQGIPDETAGRIGVVDRKDTSVLTNVFNVPAVKQQLPRDLLFCYGTSLLSSNGTLELYAIKTKMQEAEVQNRDIESAEADFSPNTGSPQITFKLNSRGEKKWARMTTDNVGKCIAILLDGKVISAPRVSEPITGGRSTISGGFTLKEAQALAFQLNSGMLPARLVIREEDTVFRAQGDKISTKLLVALLAFFVGAGGSLFIFNMLKNN